MPLATTLEKLEIGKGELLVEGEDLLLLPIGNRVSVALQAAEGLEKIGIRAAVINPRFIKPLDGDLICTWARRTGRVITIEDNVRQGGFGSAVLELFCNRGLSSVKTCILAHPDEFVEHGPQTVLWKNSRTGIKMMGGEA